MARAENYAEAAIAELVAAFPDAFTLDPTLVRPLKLGIKDDLYARSSMSRRRITAALRAYCNSAQYLAVCKEGAVRVDQSGSAGRRCNRDRGGARASATKCQTCRQDHERTEGCPRAPGDYEEEAIPSAGRRAAR
jgi:sRNA-binding protein